MYQLYNLPCATLSYLLMQSTLEMFRLGGSLRMHRAGHCVHVLAYVLCACFVQEHFEYMDVCTYVLYMYVRDM